jgi:hypothetical protein
MRVRRGGMQRPSMIRLLGAVPFFVLAWILYSATDWENPEVRLVGIDSLDARRVGSF